jgi:hypothetical protein
MKNTEDGFVAWCEAADRLADGGRIDFGDADARVVSKRRISGKETVVHVEHNHKEYSALIYNEGAGQNAFFRPV